MLSLAFENWNAPHKQMNPLTPLSSIDSNFDSERTALFVRSLTPGIDFSKGFLPPLFKPTAAPLSLDGIRSMTVSAGVPNYLVCGTDKNMFTLYDILSGDLVVELDADVDGSLLGGVAYAVHRKESTRVVFMAAYSSSALCCYYYKDKVLEQQKITADELGLKDIAAIQCLPMTDAPESVSTATKETSKGQQQFSLLVADKCGKVARLTIATKSGSLKIATVYEAKESSSLKHLQAVAVPLIFDSITPFSSSSAKFSVLVFISLNDEVVIKACGTVPQVFLSIGVLTGSFLPKNFVASAITSVEVGYIGGFQSAYSLRILFAADLELTVVSLTALSAKYELAPNEVSFKLDCVQKCDCAQLHSVYFLESDIAVLFCNSSWHVVFLVTPMEALGQKSISLLIRNIDSHGFSGNLCLVDIDTPFYTTKAVAGPRLLCKAKEMPSGESARILTMRTLDALCTEHASLHSQHLVLPLLYNHAYKIFGLAIIRSEIFSNTMALPFNPLNLSACTFLHENNFRSTAWMKHVAGSLQPISFSENDLRSVDSFLDTLLHLYDAPFVNDAHGYFVSTNLLAIAASLNALLKLLTRLLKHFAVKTIIELPSYISAALCFLAINFQLRLPLNLVSTMLDIVSLQIQEDKDANTFVCPFIRDPNFILFNGEDSSSLLNISQTIALLNCCAPQDLHDYETLINLALDRELGAALFILYNLRFLEQCRTASTTPATNSDVLSNFFDEVKKYGAISSPVGLHSYHKFLQAVIVDYSDITCCARSADIAIRASSGHLIHLPVYLADLPVIIDPSVASSSSKFKKFLHGNVFTGNPNKLVVDWICIDSRNFCTFTLLYVVSKVAQVSRKPGGSGPGQFLELNHVLITLQNLVFDTTFTENLKDVDSIDNPQIFKRIVTTGRLNFNSLLLLSHTLLDITVITLDLLRCTAPGSPLPKHPLEAFGILPEIDGIAACKMFSRMPTCCWVYLLLVRAMESPSQLEACLIDESANNVFTRAFSSHQNRELYSKIGVLAYFPTYFMAKYFDFSSQRFTAIFSFLYYAPWYLPLDFAQICTCLEEILCLSNPIEFHSPKPNLLHLSPSFTSASLLINPAFVRPAAHASFLSLLRNDLPSTVDNYAKSALPLLFTTFHGIAMPLFTHLHQILPIDQTASIDDLVYTIVRVLDTISASISSDLNASTINPTKRSVKLINLLSGIDYRKIPAFTNDPVCFSTQLLQLFQSSPYDWLKLYFYKHLPLAQAMKADPQEDTIIKTAYIPVGIRFLFSLLFPSSLLFERELATQLNGTIKRSCSKISGRDINGPEILLFGINEDGNPLHDWLRFVVEHNPLTQEQKGLVYSVIQFLVHNCIESNLVKNGQQEILAWITYLIPLMDQYVAKRVVDEALSKSSINSEAQFLISLQLAQLCDAGSISIHFYQRFRTLLNTQNIDKAEVNSFITKTLALYLSQLKAPDKAVLKELITALDVLQDEKMYLEFASSTLSVIRETMYAESADTLVLHLMQLGITPRTFHLVKLISNQLNSDLITRGAILDSGIADQSHSLNLRLTLLKQGATIDKLRCSMCQQPVYTTPVFPKTISTSIEAGKQIPLERHITQSEARTVHTFSCSHIFHHSCLTESEESIRERAAILDKYLLGEVAICEYTAHYKIECPICK